MPLRKGPLASTVAPAQWLHFQTPGTPRTRDGKPDLTAPVPRVADGKPDLSGVWMHEITIVEEVKRLVGHRFDEAIQVNALGMEIGMQHKYRFDILLVLRPSQQRCSPALQKLSNDSKSSVGAVPVRRVLAALQDYRRGLRYFALDGENLPACSIFILGALDHQDGAADEIQR